MPSYWCVNKSGSSQPIYNLPWYIPVSQKSQIGTMLNREAYIIIGDAMDAGPAFWFRNSAGSLVQGHSGEGWPSSAFDSISQYPYSQDAAGSYLYCKSARNIYKPDGSLFATVAAGKRVRLYANNPDLAGASHPEYLIISAYETSTNVFSTINGAHGFVDMGIKTTGSGYNNIPVYGSW